METNVLNLQGKETGKISLPAVFETKVSPALLHEVATAFLANQRQGTHSTKTRAEVSGGGKKPWRQKGTGNARSGSNRSPLWRKGGITFGPKPHGYHNDISRQKRQSALKMALSAKAANGSVMVIEDISISEPKTKKVTEILGKLKLSGEKILLISEKADKNLKIASRNIPDLVLSNAKDINMYQVMWAMKIVLTQEAVKQLGEIGK
ncbi:MAG: 50S ribosomal protein L4 [Elusimicrobiota bacterium]